jgi:glycosyltransferase involved in cell wall biosynthesis
LKKAKLLKLIIQIPCFNEEDQLPDLIPHLPRVLEGFDKVEFLVVDDGSSDRTVAVAQELGVDHIVRLRSHLGLARAFSAGIDAGLKLGADVIVNTDADHQYDSSSIPDLVAPLVEGVADVAIGDRSTSEIDEFGFVKRYLQRAGSRVLRIASGSNVADASSGFRAYTRVAAMQLNIVTRFSYTLESLIQAGTGGLTLVDVPVQRNAAVRPSRLFSSQWGYVRRSGLSIVRVYAQYRPLPVFLSVAVFLAGAGLIAWTPFLWDLLTADGSGHIQSLIVGSVLLMASVQVGGLAILADAVAANRLTTQQALERIKAVELLRYSQARLHPGVPHSLSSERPKDGE